MTTLLQISYSQFDLELLQLCKLHKQLLKKTHYFLSVCAEYFIHNVVYEIEKKADKQKND